MSPDKNLSQRLAIATTLQQSNISAVQTVGHTEVMQISQEIVHELKTHQLTSQQAQDLVVLYLASQQKSC